MTDEVKPAEEKPQYMTKSEMETMLATQEQKFGSMFTRLIETLTPKPAAASAGGNDGGERKLNFYDKPEEAANALFEQKMAPMREAYIGGEKGRQLNEIATLPYANKYLDEVKKVIESAPAIAQIQPGFAREAYNLVIGRHREEVFKAMQEEEAKKQAPEFTETVSAGAPAGKKSDSLSSDEREVANGMGLSDDEYRQWRDNPGKMAAAAMNPQKKAS